MIRVVANLLRLQLPVQERTIDDAEAILNTLSQKLCQTGINNALLLFRVPVPVNHLMGVALTATTHSIADACGADTNAGGFDFWKDRHRLRGYY